MNLRSINVGIVFLLAIPDPNEQLSLYRVLLKLFNNSDLIQDIINTRSETAFINRIKSISSDI